MNYFAMPGLKRQFVEMKRLVKKDIIINAVCQHFSLYKHEILSRRRRRKLTHARYIAFMLLYKYTPMNKSEIGSEFSLDHTSVIHGMNRMKSIMEERESLMDDYIQIELEIKQSSEV